MCFEELTCPLCNARVPAFHRRSHVIPDWMYENTFNERHKAVVVSAAELETEKVQTGFHGSYWCNTCEGLSSKWDTYASRILPLSPHDSREFRAVTRLKSSFEGHEFEIWRGVDFSLFQKFVFSVILRCELFKRKKGQRSIIAPIHFERLRDFCFASDVVDDCSYPIIVVKHPESDNFRNIVELPYAHKLDGHWGAVFTASGYRFHVIASSHFPKPESLNHMRLRSSGELVLMHMNVRDLPNLAFWAKTVKQIHAKNNG